MILLDTNVISETMRATPEARVIAWLDAQIAAIATAKNLAVATRDVTPFEAAGVPVVNPWDNQSSRKRGASRGAS